MLEQEGYITKTSEDDWQATEKGQPLVHSYSYNEIVLEGSGTIYWKNEMVDIVRGLVRHEGQQADKNEPTQITTSNPHIQKLRKLWE